MKRYVKPSTTIPEAPGSKAPEPIISDISVERLIEDSLLAIYREVKNLLMLSAKGKMEAASARDLRDYTKLLFELKDRENQMLKGLTDEDLKKLLDAPPAVSKEDDDESN